MDDRSNIEIPLHAFNQWSFCAHRMWLMYTCGEMKRNHHVFRGLRAHKRVDRPSIAGPDDAPTFRSLRVRHGALGLVGVVDLLEHNDAREPIPVETKAGKLRGERPWPNDVLQVAAQAMCVEDTLGVVVQEGCIYYAGSRRRCSFSIDDELRELVSEACEEIRLILSGQSIPTPQYKARCEGCSLFESCLPTASDWVLQGGEFDVAT